MENDIYVTLQSYLNDVEGYIYTFLGIYLVFFVAFWSFLSGRNEDEY
ncbi:MAG: hmc operon protein 4 [Deltaproteobacteria bacterium]|nr:hmc operon protein 4 [Deltaproteobacteria bacterium]